MKIPNNIQSIINTINYNNYECFVVGGAVRNFLLNQKIEDFDLCTNADNETIIKMFPDCKVNNVGSFFKVVVVDGIEIASYRKDTYLGLSDKNVIVESASSLIDDLSRRDLTINSIAYNAISYEFIDPFNGISDLKNRIIRFTGNPKKRIYEDPCRIIRACRFLSAINGSFDEYTYQILCKHSQELIGYIKSERIRLEILKAMKYEKPSLFFLALDYIGILKYIFCSLYNTFSHPHGGHHIEDIGTHSLLCGNAISSKFPLLRLASFLHDIGKPATCHINEKSDNFSFLKHDKVGAEIAKEELARLKFSNEEISYISKIIELHMHNTKSNKSLRKLIRLLDTIPLTAIVRIKIADRKGNLGKQNLDINWIRDILERIKHIKENKQACKFADLTVNGHDIMEILNVKPGIIVGKILNYLLDLVVDSPQLNTKEQLTEIIKIFKEN
jgi:putative nucleotidyltransferase with HDIG domain